MKFLFLKRVLLASLTPLLVAAPSARAQTAWNLSVTVKASDYNAATPGGVPVVVLGAGETLLLTDVIMTHNVSSTTGTFRANLRRGLASNPTPCTTVSTVLAPFVSPLETVSLNLSSPLEFKPGEQVCIYVGGAVGTDGVSFNLVGVKLP